MNEKKVVYTAIFGGDYYLHQPTHPNLDWDFVCFTDDAAALKAKLKASWDVNYGEYPSRWSFIEVPRLYQDPARDSKKPKILPHRYLSSYDISLWIDADAQITGDLNEFVDQYLTGRSYAVFNHEFCSGINSRNCIYKEGEFIIQLGKQHTLGHYKDSPEVIQQQLNRYKEEGFPAEYGQARNTVILRRHNTRNVIDTMEMWWEELEYGSKRDQLSFPFALWKSDMLWVNYINMDIDNNKWFRMMKKWKHARSGLDVKGLLESIPDKWTSKSTTTRRWKYGLYEFIKNNDIKSVLEIGSSTGWTTFFVAHFVNKVTSVDILADRILRAKNEISKDHNNIIYVVADVYAHEWNFGYHDLTIIDCVHDYRHVKMDIENAIKLGTSYIAFDDYGLFPELKQAIDEYILEGKLELAARIGYPKGTFFSMASSHNVTRDKILADSEGLVCRVVKN